MSENTERAVLAGGCFWIMQQLLRDRDGVISTRVGWIGGENENPTEENNVGHAEAVEVTFDPGRLSYRQLLEYFFMVHRADLGEDVVGAGYRSEIFHVSEEQRVVAEETIRDVDAAGHWPGKVVTRVSEAGRFWEDALEQQDYLQRLPVGCPARPSRGRASRLRLPEPHEIAEGATDAPLEAEARAAGVQPGSCGPLVPLNVRFLPILLHKSYGDISDETMESELRMQGIEVALLQPSAIQSCAPRPPKYFCNSICHEQPSRITCGSSVSVPEAAAPSP